MLALAEEVAAETFANMPRARRRDPDAVADAVSRAVRAVISQNWGKKANCLVHVLVV